jgi:hypothetical protein
MADTQYEEITEAAATERGLPELADTTYRRDADGVHRAYNVTSQTFWKLGASPFGADLDIGGLPRDKGPISEVIAAAQAMLAADLEARGARVLCAVMLVHVEGLEPSAGLDVHADDDGGPQDPQDVLDFALAGVRSLAARYGIPFALFDIPAGGQG